MPDYRITIKLRMGQTKTGIRYYSRHDKEDVRKYFEKKVYEKYSKYLVDNILIDRVEDPDIEPEESTF